MLTPKDIEMKEFAKGVRGYKESEVDEFLNYIILDMQTLIDENRSLKEELSKAKEQIKDYGRAENSLASTLEKTKALLSDIAESSEKRAEFLVRSAALEAEDIKRQAKARVASMKIEMEQLLKQMDYFKKRYRSLIEEELNIIEIKRNDLASEITSNIELFLEERESKSYSQSNRITKAEGEVRELDDAREISELEKKIFADIKKTDNKSATKILKHDI